MNCLDIVVPALAGAGVDLEVIANLDCGKLPACLAA